MPNSSSHANHVAIRTCVVCKKKVDQKGLLNFHIVNCGIVFDLQRLIQVRKYYLCPSAECFSGLEKWQKRAMKRHKTARK